MYFEVGLKVDCSIENEIAIVSVISLQFDAFSAFVVEVGGSWEFYFVSKWRSFEVNTAFIKRNFCWAARFLRVTTWVLKKSGVKTGFGGWYFAFFVGYFWRWSNRLLDGVGQSVLWLGNVHSDSFSGHFLAWNKAENDRFIYHFRVTF